MKTLCYASRIPLTYAPYDMPSRPHDSKELILRDRRIFAKNFKSARKKAGLTQEQLIAKTGLTRAFISDIENEKRTLSLDNAIILSDAVGESLRNLLNPPDK